MKVWFNVPMIFPLHFGVIFRWTCRSFSRGVSRSTVARRCTLRRRPSWMSRCCEGIGPPTRWGFGPDNARGCRNGKGWGEDPAAMHFDAEIVKNMFFFGIWRTYRSDLGRLWKRLLELQVFPVTTPLWIWNRLKLVSCGCTYIGTHGMWMH